jgi:hypothetical protein
MFGGQITGQNVGGTFGAMLRAKNATNHPTYLCLVAPSCESDATPPHPDMPTPPHPARFGLVLRAGGGALRRFGFGWVNYRTKVSGHAWTV